MERIGAVILNAGKSARMGRPKGSLPYDEKSTFLDRAIHLARVGDPQRPVVVVVGLDASARRLDVVTAVNPAPDRGMFSSIRVGVEAAFEMKPDLEALLLFLVDHPLVAETTVAALFNTYQQRAGSSLVPTYDGRMGHPVLLSRAIAIGISKAHDGSRLDHLMPEPDLLPVDDPGIVRNINTPEEYQKHVGRLG